MSKPEAVRYMQKAVATSLPTGGISGGSANAGSSTARSGGSLTARSGSLTARSGNRSARGARSDRRMVARSSANGAMRDTLGQVTMLQLRREYDERLETERQHFKKKEAELEDAVRVQRQEAHKQAIIETSKGLTKLRQQQHRQLHAHNKMHEAAETEKVQAAAKALQLAAAQRDALKRTQAETKAEADAAAAEKLKQMEDRHHEHSRLLEERLNAAAQRKIDTLVEQKRREAARADKLEKERDAARDDAKASRANAERVLKDKEEALREAASQALREKNKAIQMEKDKAETARMTAMQAEAVRAEVVKSRSLAADEITALATQALKVAEEEKKTAADSWKRAEAERERAAAAREENEFLRDEVRLEIDAAKKIRADANSRVEKMAQAMEIQKAALDAVKRSASAEKVALMKAAEEAKAAALAAVAEEREAEKAKKEADRAARKASAALAQRLGVSSEAYVPPPPDEDDDDDDANEVQRLPGAAARSGKAARFAMLPAGATASGPEARALLEQLDSAMVRAEQAETRCQSVEDELSQLREEIASRAGEMESLRSGLATAARDRVTALTRLREAFATSIRVRPSEEIAIEQAMSIAGSEAYDARTLDELLPTATIGIVCSMRVSDAVAEVTGLDQHGSGPAVLYVRVGGGDMDIDFTRAVSAAAVAFKEPIGGNENPWVIKWVVDAPLDGSPIDPAIFAQEQRLTIATPKDGLVLASRRVRLSQRPDGVRPSSRYDYSRSRAASQKMQAIQRGRVVRKELSQNAARFRASAFLFIYARRWLRRGRSKRAKQEGAATRIQSLRRGKVARQRTSTSLQEAKDAAMSRQLEEGGWTGVFVIVTRKPLICRETFELNSARMGEVGPQTRVTVVAIHPLPDSITRALIQLEGAAAPLGWLTAEKSGQRSLRRPEDLEITDPDGAIEGA